MTCRFRIYLNMLLFYKKKKKKLQRSLYSKKNGDEFVLFRNAFMCNYLLISAPGSYDIEKSERIIHQSSGAVTFGIKYKEQKPDDIPGIIIRYISNVLINYNVF